jgi:mersacidin/lichenicidin family type 2 lantibiotic
MNKLDAIRAWKDPAYRATLSEGDRARLPQHPSGLIELSDDEISLVSHVFFAGRLLLSVARHRA